MEEHNRNIIYANETIKFPKHLNFGKMVIDIISKYKDKNAMINGASGEKITFHEMAQQIVNASSSLVRLGVKQGDVIGVCSENRLEYFISVMAVICSGATVTLINSAYSKDELMHTMNISKPKYMFLSPTTYKTYYETMEKLNFVTQYFVYGDNSVNGRVKYYRDLIAKHVEIDAFKFADYKGETPTALILYSSGTTGLPKGAKLTHLNLITAGFKPLPTHRSMTYLLTTPFSNTMGIICTINTILCGETLVFLAKFDEKVYLQCIAKYKVGVLVIVPPMIVILCKSNTLKNYDTSSVELLYCGGAPLDVAVMDEIKAKLPNLKHILQGYGMTEMTGAITDDAERAPRQGTVGRVTVGNIIKVADLKTRKPLGPNQQGEVCVKGTSLFTGYIGRDLKDDLDIDGFYKTGDIGYYDENNYFYIVDRLKELIKYKAGQVAPSELEGILLQHPAVKDAAVAGTPDQLAGELPTAFIVKKPNAKVTEKELVDYVATKVSSWKQLRGGVKFLSEIPKTTSGKILRRKLRDILVKPLSKL